MKKTIIYFTLITLGSKIFGFAREIILSYYYGASEISDAYLISNTISIVVVSFITSGIGASFIPMFSKISQEIGKQHAQKYMSNLINLLMLIASLLVILTYMFSDQIVRAFAVGFNKDTLLLASFYTKISILSIFFMILVSVLSGYLQLNKKFIITAFLGLPLNIIIIASILLSSMISHYILPFGFFAAYLIQFLIVLFYAKRYGYKNNLKLELKEKNTIGTIIMSAPIILSISVNQINTLVDRSLASKISVGGISALNYANRLNGFLIGVFVMSLLSVLYPSFSEYASKKDYTTLKSKICSSITGMNFFLVPSSLGILFFSKYIVSLLFARGAFDNEAIQMTSDGLFYYSVGLVSMGLQELFSRVFYALRDTKTPVYNASFGIVVNIILNIILSRYLGIGGLALATSIAATFTTFLLFISLRKKIGPFGMKQISISFLKILLASLVMGGLAKLSFNYLTSSLSQNLSLLIAIAVGAVSYFVIIYFMKIEDVDVIVGAIKKKFGSGAT